MKRKDTRGTYGWKHTKRPHTEEYGGYPKGTHRGEQTNRGGHIQRGICMERKIQ